MTAVEKKTKAAKAARIQMSTVSVQMDTVRLDEGEEKEDP